MATSRSADPSPVAGIEAFSGRPNPTWPLQSEQLDRLRKIWNGLQRSPAPSTHAPALGYRGCFVLNGDERWTAFRDAVTLKTSDSSESRRDERREFERLILESAPADVPVAAIVGPDRS